MVSDETDRLFEELDLSTPSPLAERMRPRTVDEFIGQAHVAAPGKLVRQIIDGAELASIVLWGPPGSGKTTLARIIANATQADFVGLSAVLSGVREVRSVAQDAARHRRLGRRTILFIDEIHRFNKAQQDAFLPFLETGDLVLIGATTENPALELVSPLLSRCRVIQLQPLSADDLQQILRRALDTEAPRGLGGSGVAASDELLEDIAVFADGDARVALTALEIAANIALRGDGVIGAEAAKEAMQNRMVRFDKGGEEHFNLISAVHKSIRNSDADAALYWLVRMLEGGVEPRYLARRLIRIASEDIGLAAPQALPVALAAFEAVERIGLPECNLALAQATVYLALAPKSNALYRAYATARADVTEGENPPVPLHLRNAVTPLLGEWGYGDGYRYAHNEEDGVSDMSCLPEPLAERTYYEPTDRGFEAELAERLRRLVEQRRASRDGRLPPASRNETR